MAGLKLLLFLSAAALGAAPAPAFAEEPLGITLNHWGFDDSARDRKAEAGDGFDRYVNGAWLDKAVIPADRASWTMGSINIERTNVQLRAILEEAAAKAPTAPVTTTDKIGAYFASFMDEERVERLGASPLAPDLARIRAATSRADLAGLMGRNGEDYFGTIISAGVFPDLKDPSRNAAYIGQPALGMPDRDYYLDAKFAPKKDAYRAYVARLLTLAGWPEPETRARDIIDFETRIAEASWTKVEQRDVTKLYNPRTLAELEKEAPGFDWKSYLAAAGLGDKVIVAEVTAFPKIAAIYAETPLDTLKAWEAYTLADNAAYFLSRPFADAWFDFHGRTLAGTQQQQPRWKRAVHTVSGGDFLYGQRSEYWGAMGWAVGEAYVAKHFSPEAKTAVEQLVANLKIAMSARIEAADWMEAPTKAEALKKLAAFKVKIGYPATPRRNYAGLTIDQTDLYGNVRRAAAFEWAVQRGFIGKQVDREEWAMTPQTYDAYNGGPSNEIAFPAAILQPPEFNPAADPAVNYGAIGAVIGHEITHSFDDQGRMFDATGAMRDWWTPRDGETFVARAAILGKQYGSYEPLPDARVNGDLTMGENIADLGGLQIALDAYRTSLGGKEAPVIDGLTGIQRFFLGYAQSWRGKQRDDAVRQQVATDPHSPRRYRIDGVVRNMEAWYDAFGVKPGDTLYLSPEERARIW